MKKKVVATPPGTPQERRILAVKMLADAGLSDQALALAGASASAAIISTPLKAPSSMYTQPNSAPKSAALAGTDVRKTKVTKDRKIMAAKQLGLGQANKGKGPAIIIIRDPNCIPCDDQGKHTPA